MSPGGHHMVELSPEWMVRAYTGCNTVQFEECKVCISRIDSKKCTFWHKLSKNSSIFEKAMHAVLCPSCKRLKSDLEQRCQSYIEVSPQEKKIELSRPQLLPARRRGRNELRWNEEKFEELRTC
jgi:hypothetical protein